MRDATSAGQIISRSRVQYVHFSRPQRSHRAPNYFTRGLHEGMGDSQRKFQSARLIREDCTGLTRFTRWTV